MTSALSPQATVAEPRPDRRRVTNALAWILVALVGLLLVEVLFEGWLQTLFGSRHPDARGEVVLDAPGWPKSVKNGLYLALAALTVAKVTIDRRWRDFLTRADIALAVLVGVMLLAGLAGGSSPELIGEALFVYFRGAIVFYALRAADPPWLWVRPILLVVGGIIALNVVIALVQMAVGTPAYTGLRWTELDWARTNRAHALLTHPNHLGHVLSLATLGMLAWLVTRERVAYGWWLLLGVLALALSATQSRESVIAVLVAAALIWLLARGGGRRILAAAALILACTAAQVVLSPTNRADWARRIDGVVSAFRVPSGAESPRPTPPSTASPTPRPAQPARTTAPPSARTTAPPAAARPGQAPPAASKPPPREIRVLFYQQGARLLVRRPLLGYGVGQFGGIVAEQNNPEWHRNPRFGPEGFNRHGFGSKQVDSFWLHLAVETGLLGLLAYLCWLFFLVQPPLRRTPRFARERGRPEPFAYWAVAAVAFVVQVAFLSASLEDPLLPALLFTIIGLAWLAPRWARPDTERPDTEPPGAGGTAATGPHGGPPTR